MKIALAQLDPVVGDIAGNSAKISRAIAGGRELGADLVVFAELSVTGYPPRDLLRKERFVTDAVTAVERLAGECIDIAALVGFVRPNPERAGRPLQNVAALLAGGAVRRVHVKALLPTYDVFDETRYFQPGREVGCIDLAGERIGLSICEDLWDTRALGRDLYADDPVAALTRAGARVIVNMAASPFEIGKPARREELFARQARRSGAAIVYVNQVGGNDELVFDGASCAIAADGTLLGRARPFEEDLLIVDTAGPAGRREDAGEPTEQLSAAIKLGLRDYVRKCGFASVVLGSSGGIDSAVVAAIAADALGPANVVSIAMPSRYSSPGSLSDAELLAKNLGIRHQVIPIEPVHAAFERPMSEVFAAPGGQVAAENIQARIRGSIVMAVSNAHGHLALATGNKSELSTGYCTLYGDMCGGLAPIGDLLKTTVYRLAEQLNAEAGFDRIPRSIIDKPPTAELKPNQTDQDKLPPYDLLDEILRRYIEEDKTAAQIVAEGFDGPTVRRAVGMVDAAEYKRKQAAPVLKVTSRAFGTGRRMPIAQRYREQDC
jgi:NAD+ synthetase